jgi:CRP-like cAMP-binding protein
VKSQPPIHPESSERIVRTRVTDAVPVDNRLINGLARNERARVLAACQTVDLPYGEIVCQAGERLRHVYFPGTSFISLMAPVAGHPPLEVGLIGHEGMIGTTLVLDVGTAPVRGLVQGPGTALRLTTAEFRRALAENRGLLGVIKRYLYVRVEQISRNAACASFHLIEERLACWLLTAHDRAHGDQFHLTHALLADLLGVQRSAITIAAGHLQSQDMIRYTRGKIQILDRQALESASCECHRLATLQYDRLLD